MSQQAICGVSCNCGPFGEPLVCGHPTGHGGPHAWSSLPTFVDGRPMFAPTDRPGASLDVQLVVVEFGPRRWRWEVRNLTTAKRATYFGLQTTERKAWIKALAVARTGFGPKASAR
jgi:hypothetical protein